jgi:hypothetical protein
MLQASLTAEEHLGKGLLKFNNVWSKIEKWTLPEVWFMWGKPGGTLIIYAFNAF